MKFLEELKYEFIIFLVISIIGFSVTTIRLYFRDGNAEALRLLIVILVILVIVLFSIIAIMVFRKRN